MELSKIEGGKTHLNHFFKKKRRSKKSEEKTSRNKMAVSLPLSVLVLVLTVLVAGECGPARVRRERERE